MIAVTFLRSLAFNLAFYLVTAAMLIASLPFFFFLPQGFGMWVVRTWSRTCVALYGFMTGVTIEVRGRENIPTGASLVAAKHQSSFETFALIPLLTNPTIVMKRAIRHFPIFGPYTVKTGMIHVDREGKTAALRALADRAREEIAKNREIIIFPEGTRRPPGAPPEYQTGIALLYRSLNVPVTPVAVNSGLFWPRRKFMRYPGTLVIEFLPAIPPGLDPRTFLERLRGAIEPASERLLAEGKASRAAAGN